MINAVHALSSRRASVARKYQDWCKDEQRNYLIFYEKDARLMVATRCYRNSPAQTMNKNV